jgi:uncharacterized cupredoxin-like copper-binding protein
MPKGPRRLLIPTAALAALALVAAGCGSSNKSSSSNTTSTPKTTASAPAGGGGGASAGGATLTETATDFKFSQPKATAKSGPVTVKMVNKGQTAHSINVEGNGLEEKRAGTVGPGQTTSLKVNLKPGKYEFYCPVDGHKQLGMKGEITVK